MKPHARAEEHLVLRGMKGGDGGGIPPWEAEWALFGPIPNEGNEGTWPGKIGFQPLPLDAVTSIPESIEILGQVYVPCRVRSTGGSLDFCEVFDYRQGTPIAYMLLELAAQCTGVLPVSFGANWGTQWWVNGSLMFATPHGNGQAADIRRGNCQFLAPMRRGRNCIVVKVIGGAPTAWFIRMGVLPIRSVYRPPKAAALPRRAAHGAGSRDYAAAGLRIEERPGPMPATVAARKARVMAGHGVEAHWLSIVDGTGSPCGRSEILPPGEHFKPGNTRLLRRQVDEIHRRGMAAMTWFPGMHSRSTALAHPDWRSVVFAPGKGEMPGKLAGESSYNLCFNSPYGEALIRFVLESIRQYDLDGFWFDGTSRAYQFALGCACEHCRRRFRENEGLNFPARQDWNDPAFRRWAAWRERDYMAYWGQLANTVRRAHPHARIVVNHLRRFRHAWHTSIPLGVYDADIISGTEAQDSPFISAFHSRLVRACGRPDRETWVGLHRLHDGEGLWPPGSSMLHLYMHHALAAITAGAMPSFGTPHPGDTLAGAYDALAALVNPRRPFLTGSAVAYAAVHMSRQSEVFHFSRRPDGAFPQDYWFSVYGWHNLLQENQFPLDLAYDDHLASARLAAYPVLVAPYSIALSDAQLRAIEQYVRGGGILVANRQFGARDEWGERADPKRLRMLLGTAAVPAPAPTDSLADSADGVNVRRVGRGRVVLTAGNIGLRFNQNHSRALAVEIGALLRRLAPPVVEVLGPARLHVGQFQQSGRMLLHIHNFAASSEADAFPAPTLTAPPPARGVRVQVRGLPVHGARALVAAPGQQLPLIRKDGGIAFNLPTLGWGEIVELLV